MILYFNSNKRLDRKHFVEPFMRMYNEIKKKYIYKICVSNFVNNNLLSNFIIIFFLFIIKKRF